MKLFVSSTKKEETYLCGPRLLSTFDLEGDTFRYVRDNLTNDQLEADDGSGALMIVKTIRLSVDPKSTQEAVQLLLDFFKLDSLQRNYCKTMRHWIRRFTTNILESWPGTEHVKCRNQHGFSAREHSRYFAGWNFRFDFEKSSHPCWPRVARQALRVKVLATVGKFLILWKPSVRSGVMRLLAARDAKARKSEAVVAAVANFDVSGLSEAASRSENALSWNDTAPQINEYEGEDEEHYEEDVDWYTSNCDDELDETAYTVGTPTDAPELLEQFDGNLEDAEASASCASASRSFQEGRDLLPRVKSARGCF